MCIYVACPAAAAAQISRCHGLFILCCRDGGCPVLVLCRKTRQAASLRRVLGICTERKSFHHVGHYGQTVRSAMLGAAKHPTFYDIGKWEDELVKSHRFVVGPTKSEPSRTLSKTFPGHVFCQHHTFQVRRCMFYFFPATDNPRLLVAGVCQMFCLLRSNGIDGKHYQPQQHIPGNIENSEHTQAVCIQKIFCYASTKARQSSN